MPCKIDKVFNDDDVSKCPSYDDTSFSRPMYGGFKVNGDLFSMPCQWCGETIAESKLDEPIDLENGFGEEQENAIVYHLQKYHLELFKNGLVFLQECEKCRNRAT